MIRGKIERRSRKVWELWVEGATEPILLGKQQIKVGFGPPPDSRIREMEIGSWMDVTVREEIPDGE